MNGTCACCGERGEIVANGWISGCYYRWYRARKRGEDVNSPPPRQRLRMADRFAEYMFLRDGGDDPVSAGRRVGLKHERRIRDYEYRRKALLGRAVA